MPSLLGALWPTWRMHHPKKWGGPSGDILGRSGNLWLTLETLRDAPRRSWTLHGALGFSGGVLEDTLGGSVDTLGMDG